MVDEMKKKMRRFEHLIGFTGILNVTSSDSMKRLIRALKTRYKQDVQNSLRLHRLEFFYDLVEGKCRKGFPRDEIKKKKATQEVEEEGQQQEGSETVTSDEVLTIQAKDVDDWKDLLTLSKIYYVLEHPRSEGLTWKRRITKKRKIDKFGDMDLIEWRVTQNFRLRGLEEWVQSRSDARKLAEQQNDTEDLETDDDARELEELYNMLDPSGGRRPFSKNTEKGRLKKKGPSTADRPFKFQDECIEDWTESYSEDSDYSDADDTVEEIEDFPDEIERKMGEFDETKMPISDEEESISELFSKYPEFSPYREDIFEQMDKAETLEEWFKLYHEICILPDEPKEDKKLDKIIEEEEEVLEEQRDKVSLEEPKEETAKQDQASEETGTSLADDQLEEKKLEDVTGTEERGKEEVAFEIEKLSEKETDVEGVAKMSLTEAEMEEISKRDEEPKRESEEIVKLETTVGVPEVKEQGTAEITERGREEAEMSKMEKEEIEELTESKVPGIVPGKEKATVKLEAAKEVAEETGKEIETTTDALEEAAKISKMEKEEIEEPTESKVPGIEPGREVAEETGKEIEATTDALEEAAKMSKIEKEETEEPTDSKELTLESEKEEDIITQELAEVPKLETAKEDAKKGPETKLNEEEKDFISGKQSHESEGVDKEFEETTNETDTEVKKMAKKSASQEEGTGSKSEDEPDADS